MVQGRDDVASRWEHVADWRVEPVQALNEQVPVPVNTHVPSRLIDATSCRSNIGGAQRRRRAASIKLSGGCARAIQVSRSHVVDSAGE